MDFLLHLRCVYLFFGAANFLQISDAMEFPPNNGNVYTERNLIEDYASNGRTLQSGDSISGKNLAFDLMTDGFQCNYKKGYFADIHSGCQFFHVCTPIYIHYKFQCPPGTLFNQRYLVCDWPYNVDCLGSERFYSNNAFQQEEPVYYEDFESYLRKELPDVPRSNSKLSARSITSGNQRSKIDGEAINLASPNSFGNARSPKESTLTFKESLGENYQLSAMESSKIAGDPPPKIIFAYTSDPNPEKSLPQLLKDIKNQQQSQHVSVVKDRGINPTESDLKTLRKSQIDTILSTSQKLNSNDIRNRKANSNAANSFPRVTQDKDNQLNGQFSYQKINFGSSVPHKQKLVTDKTVKDLIRNHNIKAWDQPREKFDLVTPNHLNNQKSSSTVTLKPSSTQFTSVELHRVNDFSVDNQLKSPTTFELPSVDDHLKSLEGKPISISTSSNIYSQIGKSSQDQKQDSTRTSLPKPNNKTPREQDNIQEKRADAYIQYPGNLTSFPARNERYLKRLESKNPSTLEVNKSTIQTQQGETRSAKRSNDDILQPVKESRLTAEDDWSMRTSETQDQNPNNAFFIPVTSFPDIHLGEISQNNAITEYPILEKTSKISFLQQARNLDQVIRSSVQDKAPEYFPTYSSFKSEIFEPFESKELNHMSSSDLIGHSELPKDIPSDSASIQLIKNVGQGKTNLKRSSSNSFSESIKSSTSSSIDNEFEETRKYNSLTSVTASVNNQIKFHDFHQSESLAPTTFSPKSDTYFNLLKNNSASLITNAPNSLNVLSRSKNLKTSQKGSLYLTNDVTVKSLDPEPKLPSITSHYLEEPEYASLKSKLSQNYDDLNNVNKAENRTNSSSLELKDISSISNVTDRPRSSLRSTRRQNHKRMLLREFLNNRLKDFKKEETERKRMKTTNKTSLIPIIVKKQKARKTEENGDQKTSLKINQLNTTIKFDSDVSNETSYLTSDNPDVSKSRLTLVNNTINSISNSTGNSRSREQRLHSVNHLKKRWTASSAILVPTGKPRIRAGGNSVTTASPFHSEKAHLRSENEQMMIQEFAEFGQKLKS